MASANEAGDRHWREERVDDRSAHTESGMKKKAGSIASAAALALAATSGGAAWGADPLTPGTISIEAKAAEAEAGASMPSFVNAVDEALGARGFTTLEEPGHAGLVADLSLSRVAVGTAAARVPVGGMAAGPGGPFGSVGAGLRVTLPTAKTRIVPLLQTRLEIRIRKRGEEKIVWQGAAMTVRAAGTRKGQDEVVASDLTEAIFRAYPAQPEGIISVP